MQRVALIAAATLLTTLAAAVPHPAEAHDTTPRVFVKPSTGLTGGATVGVAAAGLPPNTDVRVVLCDGFGNPDEICPDLAVVTTSDRGTFKVIVELQDPVLVRQPFGDGRMLYCRADQCRIGVVAMPSESDEFVAFAQTTRLIFRGSPATVGVEPFTDLAAWHWVRVSGTAHGAIGRKVRIVEQACYQIIQGTGCYAALPPRFARVRGDGTFSAYYLARRYLPFEGGQVDCTAGFDMLGECVISATVLSHSGEPDDSFGRSAWGQPMAPLQFRPDVDTTSEDVPAGAATEAAG